MPQHRKKVLIENHKVFNTLLSIGTPILIKGFRRRKRRSKFLAVMPGEINVKSALLREIPKGMQEFVIRESLWSHFRFLGRERIKKSTLRKHWKKIPKKFRPKRRPKSRLVFEEC